MTTETLEKKTCCGVPPAPTPTPRVEEHRPRFRPMTDIREDHDAFTIRLDMPGVSLPDLDIQIEAGELTVRGKTAAALPAGRAYLVHEYAAGDYEASFRINGEAVDAEHIGAEWADGVLTLRLPKTEAVRPRRIQVSAR